MNAPPETTDAVTKNELLSMLDMLGLEGDKEAEVLIHGLLNDGECAIAETTEDGQVILVPV